MAPERNAEIAIKKDRMAAATRSGRVTPVSAVTLLSLARWAMFAAMTATTVAHIDADAW